MPSRPISPIRKKAWRIDILLGSLGSLVNMLQIGIAKVDIAWLLGSQHAQVSIRHLVFDRRANTTRLIVNHPLLTELQSITI